MWILSYVNRVLSFLTTYVDCHSCFDTLYLSCLTLFRTAYRFPLCTTSKKKSKTAKKNQNVQKLLKISKIAKISAIRSNFNICSSSILQTSLFSWYLLILHYSMGGDVGSLLKIYKFSDFRGPEEGVSQKNSNNFFH